jgi:hypothetical protein
MNITRAAQAARIVPGESACEHRGFVDKVWVEVHVAEARLGCMQRGVGEVAAAHFHEHVGRRVGDLFREPEVLGQGTGTASLGQALDQLLIALQ